MSYYWKNGVTVITFIDYSAGPTVSKCLKFFFQQTLQYCLTTVEWLDIKHVKLSLKILENFSFKSIKL